MLEGLSVCFKVSRGERRRDSVGIWSVERKFWFQLKANVYKGSSGRLWLLHSSRMRSSRIILLSPALLRKMTLCLLGQTVLLLFLLLLQRDNSVCRLTLCIFQSYRLSVNSFLGVTLFIFTYEIDI